MNIQISLKFFVTFVIYLVTSAAREAYQLTSLLPYSLQKEKEVPTIRVKPQFKKGYNNFHQELRQEVPIIPGKFCPTFRSVSGHEDLYVKRIINTDAGSDVYITDKFAMLNLCLGLHSINRRPLLSHLDKDGNVNPGMFENKLNQILKYPIMVLADLSVNYTWFGRRLERLLVVDNIKGF